ncbi:MAG: thioredoxin domain-containing protein [Patescibacteria group bacterium]
MDSFSPITQWYRTKTGAAFIAILSAILFFGVIFLSFLAYYLWQIKYGDAQKLAEQFSQKFTVLPGSVEAERAQYPIETMKQIIRPQSPTLGRMDAPVTVIEFIDFECPYCQESYGIVKGVKETYAPVLRVVFKHFPIESIHPNAMQSAFGSACAGEQGKFWQYYDLLFQTKQLDPASLRAHAEKLNLNMSAFTACLDSERYRSAVEQDLIDGVNLGVRGTPTYFVNGMKVEGVVPRDVWDRVILDEINKKK